MAPTLAALMLPYWVVSSAAVFADVLQHGAQVFEVEQQQAVVVGDLEREVQHAGLRFVHVAAVRASSSGPMSETRGAHRVALFAEHVPHHDGAGA